MAKSMAGDAIHTPSMPPIRNMGTKPSENSMGGSKRIFPYHNAASQMKKSTPVGMEIISVVMLKKGSSTAPVVNMWWAHTENDNAVTRMNARTTPWYPNSGLPENTGMTSLMIPQAPRINMYTSGCPKNQNTFCQLSGLPPLAGLKNAV